MTCETSLGKGVDAHRAIRQFERFLGIDTNAPRDDQGAALSFDELAARASERSRTPVIDPDEGTLIATMTYYPDEGRVEIKRVVDTPNTPKAKS